ncbi:uncharacterized protein LOC144635519 [Oculina patagonica]
MAAFPNRSPSVCVLAPRELSYEKVEIDKIYIPANALIIAENEQIFLAVASILKELKAVLIGDAGYVYTGKIGCRIVFLLKCRGSGAVIQTIKTLKPKAGIFLGFAKSLLSRPHEIGDVIIAEAILRKDSKQGKLESHACSECLINVFENGKYGWTPPKYRKQTVHVGKVLQMGDVMKNEKTKAVAVKTTSLDIAECSKGLGREWISILGVVGTPRYHGDTSWEPYVAAVMSSLVNQVLQDDQVFAILGGEGSGPRRHSPLVGAPLQETLDGSVKIDDFYSPYGFQFSDSDISQERVKRQAEMYWAQVKDAFDNGVFHLSHQHNPQSNNALNPDDFRIIPLAKSPVEHIDGKIDKKAAFGLYKQSAKISSPAKLQSVETGSQQRFPNMGSSHRLALPTVPSNKTGNTEVAKRRKSLPSVQRRVSGGTAHESYPTVPSSMAVTMQAALLPLGATLQSQGSCYEIIRIRAEERTAVSSRLHGGVLPPITRGKNN